jgi:antitoxin VapB
MAITKIFMSGNSQAVRLPKEFQFEVDEVEILRRGDEIILRKKRDQLVDVFTLLGALSEDFMQDGRQQPPPQERPF